LPRQFRPHLFDQVRPSGEVNQIRRHLRGPEHRQRAGFVNRRSGRLGHIGDQARVRSTVTAASHRRSGNQLCAPDGVKL
jgi:hypothetical protein